MDTAGKLLPSVGTENVHILSRGDSQLQLCFTSLRKSN